MRKIALFLSMLGIAVAIQADTIVPISSPFTGVYSEGFETQPDGVFVASLGVFGDGSTVESLGGPNLLVTVGWDFLSDTDPHSGDQFMGGAHVNYRYIFAQPAYRFGGYFNTNTDVAGATVNFYDVSDNLMASLTASAPTNGQWAWNGWETRGAAIARIEVIANNSFGGFIMQDDMTYSPIPEPTSLLLLGTGLGALGLVAWRRKK